MEFSLGKHSMFYHRLHQLQQRGNHGRVHQQTVMQLNFLLFTRASDQHNNLKLLWHNSIRTLIPISYSYTTRSSSENGFRHLHENEASASRDEIFICFVTHDSLRGRAPPPQTSHNLPQPRIVFAKPEASFETSSKQNTNDTHYILYKLIFI